MNSLRAYNMKPNDLVNINSNFIGSQNAAVNDQLQVPHATNDTDLQTLPVIDEAVRVDISSVWKDVADKINLRSATAEEVAELSSNLFKAKAITFEDHVNLSFQKNPNDAGKMDFINYWQERQEIAIHHGADHDDLNDIIRIQSILGYVDILGG